MIFKEILHKKNPFEDLQMLWNFTQIMIKQE